MATVKSVEITKLDNTPRDTLEAASAGGKLRVWMDTIAVGTGDLDDDDIPGDQYANICLNAGQEASQTVTYNGTRYPSLSGTVNTAHCSKTIELDCPSFDADDDCKTDLYDEVNRFGTENLIQAAEYSGVRRFIFISSKTASSNGGAYAKSKILAEEGLIRSKCDWVILRPAEVYGMDSNGSIEKIINLVKKGYYLPIVGNGDYTLAPVFVDDVVNGIVSTIDNRKATRKVFVLEGPKEYTFIELVEVLENQLKRKIHKVYLPVFVAKILALFLYILKSEILYRDQIPRLLCRKTKGHNSSFDDLGIKPRSLEEEIETICHT